MVSTNRTEAKFKRVHIGMIRAEVEKIMSRPTWIRREIGDLSLTWFGYDGGFSVCPDDSGKVSLLFSGPMNIPWDRLRAMYVQNVQRPGKRRGVAFPQERQKNGEENTRVVSISDLRSRKIFPPPLSCLLCLPAGPRLGNSKVLVQQRTPNWYLYEQRRNRTP